MPSPFPGMDPYIEMQEWEDFHPTFNTVMREWLAPTVEPKYVVRVEKRVYVEQDFQETDQVRWGDVTVLLGEDSASTPIASAGASAVAIAPVECIIPMPQERHETYLVIRERETMEVVTVIETLSPSNKRATSNGRDQCLEKRREILQSRTHLVELDLLRGGQRLPMGGLPPGDYYAIVSRVRRRPRAQTYAWTIRHPLPPIPIPLKGDDPDALLDLQAAFAKVYDRARYQLSLDYSAPLIPPLSAPDAIWAAEQLAKTA